MGNSPTFDTIMAASLAAYREVVEEEFVAQVYGPCPGGTMLGLRPFLGYPWPEIVLFPRVKELERRWQRAQYRYRQLVLDVKGSRAALAIDVLRGQHNCYDEW